MPSPREPALLARAARLYYVEGRSQAEVATAIGVSRSNVSRVLAAAREQGIVEIRINDSFDRDPQLEQELQRAFGLLECRVASRNDFQSPLLQVGGLGASWVKENLPDAGSIALSWGSSVQAVVDSVEAEPIHTGLQVLPLIGGLSIVDAAADGNVLVRSLALKLGADDARLHAPAVVGSQESRDTFLREPSIRNVLDAACKAEFALVGIGSVGSGASASIIDAMQFTPAELEQFLASGAVGDCCTRFFDEHGAPVDSPADGRVVSIDLHALRNIKRVVGVATGANKASGVRGAILGGFIDVLIIDSALAAALLSLQ
ncbi:sugar-binding transcriptional regulator [Pseudarthrobacter sp. NPDC080039]|uniref:sugar-binding transcriptional regulator n=1 Tax=unclassified Pseudarthrobacter TaxID=2647000 RepID=UPI00344B56D3